MRSAFEATSARPDASTDDHRERLGRQHHAAAVAPGRSSGVSALPDGRPGRVDLGDGLVGLDLEREVEAAGGRELDQQVIEQRHARGDVRLRRCPGAMPARRSQLAALDVGAERAEPLVDALVAAVDLADVADARLAFGAERRDHHRHAGADVGALEALPDELRRAR